MRLEARRLELERERDQVLEKEEDGERRRIPFRSRQMPTADGSVQSLFIPGAGHGRFLSNETSGTPLTVETQRRGRVARWMAPWTAKLGEYIAFDGGEKSIK